MHWPETLEVKYLSDRLNDRTEHMPKEKLDVLLQHRPVIEIDGRTHDIDQVNYDVETGIFYFYLRDR